jgi:tetratricopeptide (TPR) repeat protein
MNVWRWVHETIEALRASGEDRLADLMRTLPSAACDGEHVRVDAIVPEALALARRIEHPWIEVFVRHWDLQSRVLKRLDVTRALPDAVSLLDFAHGEGTRDCPQSVCAVQDLAACYALMDGPGFVEERLAVTRETLARIDPSWSCFQCVATEEADALLDAGDPGAALAFTDRAIAAVESVPGHHVRRLFAVQRAEILAELGRCEEALVYLEQCRTAPHDDAGEVLRERVTRARLFAALGRHAEAASELPSPGEMGPFPKHYLRWLVAVRLLVDAGAWKNDWELGVVVRGFAMRLADRGIVRMTIQIWLAYADLALARGSADLAARAAEVIDPLMPRLAKPVGAPEQLAALRARIDIASEPTGDDAGDEAAALAAAGGDPEVAARRLARARALFPGSEPIVLAHAQAMAALGFPSEACAELRAFFDAHPDSVDVPERLAEILEDAPSPEPLAALDREVRARSSSPQARGSVTFHHAARLLGDRRFAECRRVLEPVLAELPRSVGTRRLFAASCFALRDFEAALAKLDEAVALADAPGAADWERMTAATICGDWGKVRESAARLGHAYEGDGEIDENCGLCRLELPSLSTESPPVYFARRTGPVTARILHMAPPSAPAQVYGDVWAFDAAPKNPPPNEGEEEDHTFVFPAVHRIREGRYAVYDLSGAHPGADVVDRLRERLRADGGAIHVLSNDDYRVKRAGVELTAIFARVAWPASVAPAQLAAILAETFDGLAHPLAYADLARAAGDAAMLAEHEARDGSYEAVT